VKVLLRFLKALFWHLHQKSKDTQAKIHYSLASFLWVEMRFQGIKQSIFTKPLILHQNQDNHSHACTI